MVEALIQHYHPCQVVSVSKEREPLRVTHMLNEPWKDVAVDFWGPIHTGEHLLVIVCKQSRWAEVEFAISTSARWWYRRWINLCPTGHTSVCKQ